jgi:hypothetical protein
MSLIPSRRSGARDSSGRMGSVVRLVFRSGMVDLNYWHGKGAPPGNKAGPLAITFAPDGRPPHEGVKLVFTNASKFARKPAWHASWLGYGVARVAAAAAVSAAVRRVSTVVLVRQLYRSAPLGPVPTYSSGICT